MSQCCDESARTHASVAICVLIGIICAFTGCSRRHGAHAPSTSVPHAYTPEAGETGLASWYGHPYDGRQAANGEIYDMETLVAAHRTLPFGTRVRVVNIENGKTVDVRIIDRGPFVGGRIIDLSHAAAEKIDLIGPGVAKVRLDIISAPPPMPEAAAFYAVQVGAFADQERAEHVRQAMQEQYGNARLVLRQGNPPLWRVLVGREPSEPAAEELEQKLGGEADHCFIVRADDVTPKVSQ